MKDYKKPPLKWRLKHWLSKRMITGWLNNKLAMWLPKFSQGDIVTLTGRVSAKYIFSDGTKVDYGTLSFRKVTNDFAALLVDHLHGGDTMEPATFWYHGAGTDNTAESSGDTALASEILRSTGTSTETSAQVYKSVATLTFTSSNSVREHGLFNGDTSAARVMMDRSVYTAIELNASDQIEYTYELTVQSGG